MLCSECASDMFSPQGARPKEAEERRWCRCFEGHLGKELVSIPADYYDGPEKKSWSWKSWTSDEKAGSGSGTDGYGGQGSD